LTIFYPFCRLSKTLCIALVIWLCLGIGPTYSQSKKIKLGTDTTQAVKNTKVIGNKIKVEADSLKPNKNTKTELAKPLNPDTTNWKSIIFKPIPKKAALRSAIAPGWGQAYNKTYWKMPIIYTGLGIASYFIMVNYAGYRQTYNAIKLRTDNDSTNNNRAILVRDFNFKKYDVSNNSNADLIIIKQYFRRNLDISALSFLAIYSVQIIEASVGAHLYNFNMDDNFTVIPTISNTGIGFVLKWK
jgi:uncharacterized protein (DUF2164 family)